MHNNLFVNKVWNLLKILWVDKADSFTSNHEEVASTLISLSYILNSVHKVEDFKLGSKLRSDSILTPWFSPHHFEARLREL